MTIPQPGMQIIRGARITEPGRRRAELADILVADGIIRDMGPPGLAAPPDAVAIDATGMLIHPGLINAHTHGAQGFSRGQFDRITLELLLTASPWGNRDRSVADKKLSAMVCAAEMVMKGVTAAYDLYAEFPLPTQDGMDAAASAYAEIGMRAVLAPQVADLSLYEAIPGLMDAVPGDLREIVAGMKPGSAEAALAAIATILQQWRWAGQDIHVAVGPTIPHHCTRDFMCGCAQLARSHGARLHTHVAESKVQAVTGLRRYGKTLTAQLDEWGILGPDFTAAHAVWLDDDDMARFADRGASIAHNPGSNMRLGNGLFQLRRVLDAGITIGIGSDGISCSDNQNIYEAMRYASMVSKGQTPFTERWASADEIYHAATIGGAKALGLEGVGEIKPGFKADLVFLDLQAPQWLPHNWTINQLVHAEDATAVRHVMIGGRMVVRDRTLLTVDMRRLSEAVEATRQRMADRGAQTSAVTDRLERIIDGFCPVLAAAPYPVRRYLDDADRSSPAGNTDFINNS